MNKKESITNLQNITATFCGHKKYEDYKLFIDYYVLNSNLSAIEAEFSLHLTKWGKKMLKKIDRAVTL